MCPFDQDSLALNEKIYVTFLSSTPKREYLAKLKSVSDETDELVVSGKMIYLLTRRGYSSTLFGNNFLEKMLHVDATTRNMNTLKKIEEIANRAK